VGFAKELECTNCQARFPLGKMFEGCPRCRDDKLIANVTVTYEYERIKNILNQKALEEREPSVWKYRELLPVEEDQSIVSLHEGGTPLVKCKRFSKEIGLKNLYIKDESRNPTWSFKDRYCSVAISKGLEFDVKTVTVSSSGNHGAATAAYASRAGLDCVIFTMGFTPATFLTLMQSYGAKVVPVSTAEGRWKLMERCVKEFDWYPTGSYTLPMPTGNPYGVEGYKTIGYEICEQLGWEAPSKILVPFGGGEGLYGIWKGITELRSLGISSGGPMMIAVEPSAGGPLDNALRKKLNYVEKVQVKPTVAFSIGSSTATFQALKAVRASGGASITVTDEEIMKVQLELAALEGLYVEPSSAASIAGVRKMREYGQLDSDEKIVCVVTSGGLKDPEATRKNLPKLDTIDPEWNALLEFLRKAYDFKP